MSGHLLFGKCVSLFRQLWHTHKKAHVWFAYDVKRRSDGQSFVLDRCDCGHIRSFREAKSP